jgi:hypothetical protein
MIHQCMALLSVRAQAAYLQKRSNGRLFADASRVASNSPTSGNDEIFGTAGNDILFGLEGDDTFHNSPGSDTFDGGPGIDTVIYIPGPGLSTAYAITQINQISTGYTIGFSGGSGVDTLINIEYVQLSDKLVYLPSIGDTTPPIVSSFSPADEAIGVAITSNIILTFTEAIARGTGNIVLKNASGTVIETYDAVTSSNLSISGSSLTINPTLDLAYSTGYKVEFASGSIKDIAGNNYVGTTAYNFTTIAHSGSNQTGTSGNDTFTSTTGNDTIDGGAGIDTAAYTAGRSNYTVTRTSTGFAVSSGTDGADALTNIERLVFADTKVALDLDGNAGTTAKILGAVFGATSVANKQYVGIGLSCLDAGWTYENLMAVALDAAGAKTHAAVVNLLWTNLVGSAPNSAQAAPYVALLDNGTYSPGFLGVICAELDLNKTHINLVGLAQTGIEYS